MLAFFLPLFLILLMIGLPVFFALLLSPGLLLWLNGQERDIALLYRNVYNGMDSFPADGAAVFCAGRRVDEPRRHHHATWWNFPKL